MRWMIPGLLVLVPAVALAQQTITVQVTVSAADLARLQAHYNTDVAALQTFLQRKLQQVVMGVVDQQAQAEAAHVLHEYVRAPEATRRQLRDLVPPMAPPDPPVLPQPEP